MVKKQEQKEEKRKLSSGVSNYMGMIVYPWENPYPVENPNNAIENSFTRKPLFIGTANPSSKNATGIIHTIVTKTKQGSASLTMDLMGRVPTDLTIPGTWVVFLTSGTVPMETNRVDYSSLLDDPSVVVKFIGQVYSSNMSHIADKEGTLRRTAKVTFRDWSHALHTPVTFHPYSLTRNQTDPSAYNSIEKKLNEVFKSGKLVQNLNTSLFNVFQKANLFLSFLNALGSSKEDGLISQEILANKEDLKIFSEAISRMPVIPEALIIDLFPEKDYNADTVWADIFIEVLSGVQDWAKNKNKKTVFNGCFGTYDNRIATKDWIINDGRAKRPLSYIPPTQLINGGSVSELIQHHVLTNAGSEYFTDLWYYEKNGKVRVQPVLVVRDIPFSLKSQESKEGSKIPWTSFDELPMVNIDAKYIISINLTQTMEKTSNVIMLEPNNEILSAADLSGEVLRHGILVMPEHQKRFGGLLRQIAIKDMVSPNIVQATQDLTYGPVPAKEGIEERNTFENTKKVEVKDLYIDWFHELQKKHRQWYGEDYRYPSGNIHIKDCNHRFCVGMNVQFRLRNDKNATPFVAHIERVDSRLTVVENGVVSNSTRIYFSRLVHFNQVTEQLERITPGAISNILRLDAEGKLEYKEQPGLENLELQWNSENESAVTEENKASIVPPPEKSNAKPTVTLANDEDWVFKVDFEEVMEKSCKSRSDKINELITPDDYIKESYGLEANWDSVRRAEADRIVKMGK